jgi:hypothetical protein
MARVLYPVPAMHHQTLDRRPFDVWAATKLHQTG